MAVLKNSTFLTALNRLLSGFAKLQFPSKTLSVMIANINILCNDFYAFFIHTFFIHTTVSDYRYPRLILRTKSQFIGRSPFKKQQTITVGDWEVQVKPIARAILHALGKRGEHTREDRDSYISINWDEVEPGSDLIRCVCMYAAP